MFAHYMATTLTGEKVRANDWGFPTSWQADGEHVLRAIQL